MFTGLIEEVGEIVEIEPQGDSLRLTVKGPLVTSDAKHGDSIQVSGVCLTAVEFGTAADGSRTFAADVMEQSLRMSTLGELRVGSRVNLERAARVDSRLGGHIVQGHVDATARLLSAVDRTQWRVLRFELPTELAPLLVDKGSVTVAGVSLTVSNVSEPEETEPWFEVSLIPETLTATTLGDLVAGDHVNIETDILARHVARMQAFITNAERATERQLPSHAESPDTFASTPTTEQDQP
ncbi:riboflavin synthase [Leucobacter sp. GX24907]